MTLTDGQSAIAEKGQAPVLRTVVRPRDAVQWALYYPPSLYLRPEEFQAGPGWQGLVRNSIEAYTKGDFQAAFEAIKGVPNDLREPRFFVYRASLLLAVGRVDEAGPDLERALSLLRTMARRWRSNRSSPLCKTTRKKRWRWRKSPLPPTQSPRQR